MFEIVSPYCLSSPAWVLYPYLIGNSLLGATYFVVPIFFTIWVYFHRDYYAFLKPLKNIFVNLAIFIFCCGIGHLLMIANIYRDLYSLQAAWNALTAIISFINLYNVYVIFISIAEKRNKKNN